MAFDAISGASWFLVDIRSVSHPANPRCPFAAVSILSSAENLERYENSVSVDKVFDMVQGAGYYAGTTKTGSLTLALVKAALQTPLFCRAATG